jgi:hypothetical protein
MTIEKAFPFCKLSFDLQGFVGRKSVKYNVSNQTKRKDIETSKYVDDENWTYKISTSTPIKQPVPVENEKNKGFNFRRKLKFISSKILKLSQKKNINGMENINKEILKEEVSAKRYTNKCEKFNCRETIENCSIIPRTNYDIITGRETIENCSVIPRTYYDIIIGGGGVTRHVTMQTTIWINQLNRLKKRTERIRQKDAELKQRYEELKLKAKRVLSPDNDDEYNASPPKSARLNEITEKLQNCKIQVRKPKMPSRIPKPRNRNEVFSYTKARNLFNKYTTKDVMSLTKDANISLNATGSDFVFTFLKNGKKCTFC